MNTNWLYWLQELSINRVLIIHQSVINRPSISHRLFYKIGYQLAIPITDCKNQVPIGHQSFYKIGYQSAIPIESINCQSFINQVAKSDTNRASVRCPIGVGFCRNSSINQPARLVLDWENQLPIRHKSDARLVTDWCLIWHHLTCEVEQ